ncbi:MAG TPA: hypothetical protein PLC82_11175, partial [Smithellaceae bacterium]|nr:hypothetical protein [Smithellaceae bacterium]
MFAFFFLWGFVGQAGAFELGARGYLWFPHLKKADFQTIVNNAQNNEINAKDVLGMGDKVTYAVEAYGGVGKNHLSLTFTPFDYSADVLLTNNITFNGKPLTVGNPVRSDLAYSMFDLKYQRDLINLENVLAGFSVGGIAQVKYSTGSFKLNQGATGFDEKKSFDSFLPMIGLGAHIGLIANLLEMRAMVTAGGYGSDNYSYEGLADLSITPFPFLDIHAGYKLMQLKMDVNDYKMDTLYTGPYLLLSIGF